MADESDGHNPPARELPDAAAVSIGLAAAAYNERVASKAEAFFERQNRLLEEQAEVTRLQIARMRAQDDQIEEVQRLEMSHLRVRRLGDYLKSAVEIAAGIILLVIFCGIGVLIWQAREANGLVVEPLHKTQGRGFNSTNTARYSPPRLWAVSTWPFGT
jgi:hypothetical protein